MLQGLFSAYMWVYSRIPLRLHYLCADILLYPLLRYVVCYRQKVLRRNLHNSFPDKSTAELKRIERKFYHFFADLLVEIPYFRYVSLQEAQRRFDVVGWEEVDRLVAQYGGAILMANHYNNWEWMSLLCTYSKLPDLKMFNVYRRLKNVFFDRLMNDIRAAHGADNVEKSMLLRHMFTAYKEGKKACYYMVADQSPSPRNIHYWTQLLHQPTAILTGSEVLAKKMNIPVFYLDNQRVKRGYYRCVVSLITEHPQEEPQFAITERYARMLEHTILQAPEYWLWTHNRWKHKPQQDEIL